MNDLLTEDDLIEVTGAQKTSKQQEILKQAGIKHWMGLDGKIRTTWFHVHNNMDLPGVSSDSWTFKSESIR